MASESETPYVLYHFAFSLCSIMVRLTYALRGDPKPGAADLKMELRDVDIARKLEQFSEEFLCKINPKGKVGHQHHFGNYSRLFPFG